MSVHELPDTFHVYEAGSLAVATLYQTWAWNTDGVPGAAVVSSTRVQPAGGVTVTVLPSSSIDATRTSPAATPAGAATVVPLVTLDRERKAGGGGAVVSVASADRPRLPFTSRLCTRKW